MSTKRLLAVLFWAMLGLQAFSLFATAVVLIRLNMLPGLYLVAVIAFMAVLLAGNGCLMFVKGKKPVGLIRRIIASLLVVLSVAGCLLVSKLATDAYQAVEKVTTKVTTTIRNVYVFVPSDDPANTLADTADYTYGYVENYDVNHTQKAMEKIAEAGGVNVVSAKTYESFQKLADALFAGEIDAAVMNGASVALLLEEEGYTDFTEKVKILETMAFSALEEADKTQDTQPTEPPAPKDITNTPFVVYVSGSDTRSKKLSVSRSDVNILAVIHPETKQVLLINTPRDYYVVHPDGNGARDKLTHCGLYGPECSMEVLSDLYDLNVDYYVQLNFTGFETLVDAVGGVTVYSDQSFSVEGGYINKGENNLNGKQALAFARERYRVSGGDNGRGKNQMKVIKAVLEKMTSGTTIISNYSSILSSLEGMFTTSLEAENISKLVKMQLSDMASWNIQSFAVTGIGGSERTYSMPGSAAYVMYEDEASTDFAAKLAARVIAGEILTEEDLIMAK